MLGRKNWFLTWIHVHVHMHKYMLSFHTRTLLFNGLLRYSVVSARRNSFLQLFAARTLLVFCRVKKLTLHNARHAGYCTNCLFASFGKKLWLFQRASSCFQLLSEGVEGKCQMPSPWDVIKLRMPHRRDWHRTDNVSKCPDICITFLSWTECGSLRSVYDSFSKDR